MAAPGPGPAPGSAAPYGRTVAMATGASRGRSLRSYWWCRGHVTVLPRPGRCAAAFPPPSPRRRAVAVARDRREGTRRPAPAVPHPPSRTRRLAPAVLRLTPPAPGNSRSAPRPGRTPVREGCLIPQRLCGHAVTHPGKTSLDYYRNESAVPSLCGSLVNDTDLTCDKRLVRQFARAFLPTFFWLIFSVGTVGNALVVLVYCKSRFRRSVMDRYLLHLAIADLLLLFTLPFWAKAASNSWIFKDFMCKVVNSMYKINLYSCSLFLTCISFDRYLTIVQATKAKTCKRRRLLRSKLMCLAVWLTSVGLCIPEIMYSQSTEVHGVTVCKMTYPPNISTAFKVTVLALKVTIGFFLPLLIMLICYTLIINTILQAKRSQKQKSLKIIAVIITAFLLSQFPYNVVLLVKTLNTYSRVAHSCQAADRLDIGLQVTQSIAFLHSCLNPFLYVFAGERFRTALGRAVQSGLCLCSRGQEQFSACDSQEHSSNCSFAMLGRRQVRNSLTLSTHLTSSVTRPSCQVLL
ncbi:C-C chemokine receptor type 9 [Colius striatus]|uniref:C-C chemokine receptor type 9 n=1 Tax=Colius striatus TaxID=57412 RepID=UPI002B1DB96D|nr:C-C chemokine receptor type 9 [Colius striatus]